MITSELSTDSDIDDTQSIDINLESLFNKFILPIDRIRSFSATVMTNRPSIKDGADLVNDAANTANTNPAKPQESRTHAFFRMIGFPVIAETGEFYSPGYDPGLKADQRKKNYNVSAKISNTMKTASLLRENAVRSRMAIFNRQGKDACLYSIAISVPNATKPFLQMNTDEGFDFVNKFDKQDFNKKIREEYIRARYSENDGSEIDTFFESGNHILRPFVVDPNIVDAVAGFSNETRHVCAPFLKTKKDTGIERSIFAKRPGIELILRLRLKSSDVNNNNITDSISNKDTGYIDNYLETLQSFNLILIGKTLLNQEQISDKDIIDRLKNVNNFELININKLVKTIKGVIDLLFQSCDAIKIVSKNIKFTPMPGEDGPETGSDITNLIRSKQKTSLEKTLLNLNIRSQQNNTIGSISDDTSILSQDFHMSQFESVEKPWIKQIQEVKEEIDSYQRDGSNALAAIEIIIGEISGLGLIDVLAIYTALWAVDINVLISMIDDNAFERLYSMQEYRTLDVESRHTNGPSMSIINAVQTFERQVINILSYSNSIFQQKLGAPLNAEGGNVPRV